ncbi:MAG: alpha/beta fold hydrolase [Lysobacterales bacterium]
MQRRTLIKAASAGVSFYSTHSAAMTQPPHKLAGAGQHWVGSPALAGGKAYAACPLGALHYRQVAPSQSGESDRSKGDTALLLLHQSPTGLNQWVDIQPILAAGGRRVIATDNPGYGMSDPPPGEVTVAQLADNLICLLDQLNLENVILAGHHTGAGIAASLAARYPSRTAAVILQGCPLYTKAERTARLARVGPTFELKADGSHLSQMFEAIYAIAGQQPQALSSVTWATLSAYLVGPNPPVYDAIFMNDMKPDIAAIKAPTLVLSDSGERLHEKDLMVAKMRPDFVHKTFSDGGSFSMMLEPQRWADEVSAFIRAAGV